MRPHLYIYRIISIQVYEDERRRAVGPRGFDESGAGSVGLADWPTHNGVWTTDTLTNVAPVLHGHCGEGMHQASNERHVSRRAPLTATGHPCDHGPSAETEDSTRVEYPATSRFAASADSASADSAVFQVSPECLNDKQCMPPFSVTNLAQATGMPVNVTSTLANERRIALGHIAFMFLLC